MSDTQFITCDNAYLGFEDLIRLLIRIDVDGNWYLATNCSCGGGSLPAEGAEGEVLTVVGGAWASAPAAASTTAKGDILNPGASTSFDVNGDLTITHNLGTEDIIVSIREADGTTLQTYPYKPINVNSVLVYCGQVITGRYIIIAAI